MSKNKVTTKHDAASKLFSVYVNGNLEVTRQTMQESICFVDSLLEMGMVSKARHTQLVRGLQQTY